MYLNVSSLHSLPLRRAGSKQKNLVMGWFALFMLRPIIARMALRASGCGALLPARFTVSHQL